MGRRASAGRHSQVGSRLPEAGLELPGGEAQRELGPTAAPGPQTGAQGRRGAHGGQGPGPGRGRQALVAKMVFGFRFSVFSGKIKMPFAAAGHWPLTPDP